MTVVKPAVETVSFNFDQPGNPVVTLTVTADDGQTSTTQKSISVLAPAQNVPPTAAFTVSGSANSLQRHFDASASVDSDGSIVSYQWDMAGLATLQGQSVDYTFPETGVYDVKLEVTDNQGERRSLSQTVVITAADVGMDDLSVQTLQATEDVGATRKGGASALSISQWNHAFLQFSGAAIGQPIAKAELVLHNLSAFDGTTKVWAAVDDNWTEDGGWPGEVGLSVVSRYADG